MDKEYIDREALNEEILHGKNKPAIYDGAQEVEWIEECIENAPVADVQPVKHGYWIKEHIGNGITRYKCSVCNSHFGEDMIIDFNHNKFCADCGAKMDKGSDK